MIEQYPTRDDSNLQRDLAAQKKKGHIGGISRKTREWPRKPPQARQQFGMPLEPLPKR